MLSPLAGQRILVVDDERGIAAQVVRRLERAGPAASRAETALELAELHLLQGETEKALVACRAGLAADAGSVPLLRLVASLCAEAGDLAGARDVRAAAKVLKIADCGISYLGLAGRFQIAD